MSATSYNYVKVVAPDTLEYQIRTSQITTALDGDAGYGIIATSTDVTIWFRATLSSSDESILVAIINAHIPIPLLYQGPPTDSDGAPIQRPKAAPQGWAYSMQSVNFTTCWTDGDSGVPFLNSALNPTTRNETDLGFASIKYYLSDNVTQATEPEDIANAIWTVIDWTTNYDIWILGGYLFQNAPPPDDLFMWVHLAPGILNYPFIEGGLNLRLVGPGGTVTADGIVSKLLSASVPMPGCNKIRITLKHDAGYQHEAQFLFRYFRAVPTP